LRHAAAGTRLELVTIKELLGHARITITADIYAHVRLRLQRQAIEAMGSALRDTTSDVRDGQADGDHPSTAGTA
jgi:hypothetical protein